jgi:signal transduction histidine kinase
LVPRAEQAGFVGRCREALKGRPQREIQSKLLCRDGSSRIVLRNIRCLPDYDGSPAVLIVANDITELKRAQERALQSERMAAIGQMCAGLAHESRNALQRSQACLEMLALKLEDRPDSLNLIGRIQQAQDDLHRLYEDVREFASPIKLAITRCDLATTWRRAWHHLEPLHAARQAVLHEATGDMELCCEVDPFRLEQVFHNILDNALAACAERPEITIGTAPANLEGREAIRLSIQDNGPGLSDEQRARMFQSFYTTKTRGTGLGLAIVKRIIEAHGGRVGLGQTGRKGAEIILTLPRQQEG